MKVHYTGRPAPFSESQERKLETKFHKCHKVLGIDRDLESHVTVSRQRHKYEAEITLRALHHTLVVSGSGADPFHAVQAAVDKLAQQVVRNKHKLIDVRRHQSQRADQAQHNQPEEIEVVPEPKAKAKKGKTKTRSSESLVRSNNVAPKPMTVEEAMLQIEELGDEHLTYRDADSGDLRVLLRRRDGKLELIEAS